LKKDWRYKTAYRRHQSLLDENNSQTLNNLELLVVMLRDDGKYEVAEEMHWQALLKGYSEQRVWSMYFGSRIIGLLTI
jgi:hypothetical protein